MMIEFQKQNSEKENKTTCCLGICIYVVESKKKRQVNDKHKIQDRGISVWRQVDQIREEFTGSFHCSGNILIFRQNYNFIN